MVNLITDLSKYLMLIIMVLYTVLNFYVLRKQDVRWQNRVCRKQIFLVFLLQFLGYLIIYLRTMELQMLIFYGIQVVFFLIYFILFKTIYPQSSRVLLSNLVFLFSIGLMMLTRLDVGLAEKQFVIGMAAAAITLFIPVIISKLKALSRWAWLYAIVGVALLLLVWAVGDTEYGAQLRIRIGSFALQPSEFVKLSFVFFTASMFQKGQSFPRVVVTTIVAAVHVLILVASTDLGSGLVYFMSYLFMLFVATRQPLYFFGGLGAGSGAAVLAYHMFSHVRVRVAMWQNPFSDYEGRGYQMAQSLFALSSGGWFGLGFYQGVPNSIPLVENDFIFSAICEELGIIFGICLVLIYLGFVLQMLWVSTWMNEIFYKIVGFGLAVTVGVQVFLHIGGVTKMIPSTGITLPLISYGGSSVVSTMLIIGVIQGLHLMKQKEVEAIEQAATAPEEEDPEDYFED